MKQSAVEWLAQEMDYLIPSDKELLILQIVNQAKEMEKQQIIDAMDVCQRTDFWVKYECTEQYYNETFKNK
jgi:hypothetical protein